MNCICGAELKEGAKFCAKCGTKVQEIITQSTEALNTDQDIIEETSTYLSEDDSNVDLRYVNVETNNVIFENNERQSQSPKKPKNTKVLLIILLVIVVLTLGVALVYFTQFRNSIVIEDVDASLYPVVTIKLEDSKGSAYKEDDFVIYQDGVPVENVEDESRGEYTLILNTSINSGENTVLSVSKVIFGSTEIKTDEEKVKVKRTLFEDNFKTSELISEELPIVTISTTLNTRIFDTEFEDSLKLVILNEPLAEEKRQGVNFTEDFANAKQIIQVDSYEIYGDDTVDLTFDLGEVDRMEPVYYTLAFDVEGLGIEYADFIMEFEPLNNLNYRDNIYLENLPNIELYLSVRDENYNDVGDLLDLSRIKVWDSSGKELTVNSKIDASGEILVELNAEDITSGATYLEYSYQDNNYGLVGEIDFDSYDLEAFKYYLENKYNPEHRYEVVYDDLTWYEALDAADAKGGYLARIGSKDEFNAITTAIKDSGNKALNYWVGATRNANSNYYVEDYYWVDAYLDPVSESLNGNSFWLTGEPSYYSYEEIDGVETFVEEDSASLFYRSSADKWYMNDVPNDLLLYYDFYKGKIAYVIEYDN